VFLDFEFIDHDIIFFLCFSDGQSASVYSFLRIQGIGGSATSATGSSDVPADAARLLFSSHDPADGWESFEIGNAITHRDGYTGQVVLGDSMQETSSPVGELLGYNVPGASAGILGNYGYTRIPATAGEVRYM
jgi:hypothetical protein